MRKNTNKAFTLVELIVVITILAILATVAFISLGGQTEKARNTTKKDAIGKLATAVENANTNGVGLASFVGTSNSKLTAGMLGGTGAIDNSDAGDINYSALDVKTEDFQDDGVSYKYGYTTVKGGKYDIAAKLTEGALSTAYLVGTYEPRDFTSTNEVVLTQTGTTLKISAADIKKFAFGDYITDGTSTGKIISISSDYLTLTVDSAISGTGVGLASATGSATNTAEANGLIGSVVSSLASPVTNNSTTDLPY